MSPPSEFLRKFIRFGCATLPWVEAIIFSHYDNVYRHDTIYINGHTDWKQILRCNQFRNGSSIKTDHHLPTESYWRHRNWGKALSHHQISYLGIEIIIKLFFYRIILLLLWFSIIIKMIDVLLVDFHNISYLGIKMRIVSLIFMYSILFKLPPICSVCSPRIGLWRRESWELVLEGLLVRSFDSNGFIIGIYIST